jgi:hypothetical protein
MANVYGFEFETPEEIKARQTASFQQQASQGDVGAYARQSIFNIFGSPELKKAEQTQAILTDSLSNFSEDPNKDPLENEMERAKIVRDRAAKVNPELAVQANDRFLRARNEFEERRRLLADDDWTREERGFKKVDLEAAKTYALAAQRLAILESDPETGAQRLYKALPPGATIDDLQAEIAKAQAENPNKVLQGGRGSDALDPQTLFRPKTDYSGAAGGVLKSGIREDITSLRSFNSVLNAQESLIETLMDNPDALNQWTREIEAGAGSLINGLEAQAQKYGIMGRDEWFNDLKSYGIVSEEAQAKVLTMAYRVAKALDPGGRLSNQDVEMAIRMVAGSGSPSAIVSLMKDRLREYDIQVQQLEWSALANNNQEQLQLVQSYKQKREGLEAKLEQFAENIIAVRSTIPGASQMSAVGNVTTNGIVQAPTAEPQQPTGQPAPKISFKIRSDE